jgi:hypothetical protein
MTTEGRSQAARKDRIRLGMVGGGEGAVHRIAARLDDDYVLVTGALSSTREKAIRSGLAIGLDPTLYANFNEIARREAQLEDGVDAVSIVTRITSIRLRRSPLLKPASM